jgi:hypothetical protein
MLYVGFVNSFETVSLDQLDNPAKPGLHVGRQGFELISNAIVEQLYAPCHPFILLHFCNIANRSIYLVCSTVASPEVWAAMSWNVSLAAVLSARFQIRPRSGKILSTPPRTVKCG